MCKNQRGAYEEDVQEFTLNGKDPQWPTLVSCGACVLLKWFVLRFR